MSDHISNQTKWLLLVPTQFERDQVVETFSPRVTAPVEICGFGPIISAARTVQLIHYHTPDRVLLLGIAGSFNDRLTVGHAFSFDSVACYGVGVGNGETFQTAGEMGWDHWHDDLPSKSIGDTVAVSCSEGLHSSQLLTVCSAAEDERDVQIRKNHFPDALAEDMEAFSVTAACKLCDIPVHLVRGISNRAGDRNKKNWRIEDALGAAVTLTEQIMGIQS